MYRIRIRPLIATPTITGISTGVIFEITSNANNDEVKKAYRDMAKKHHPDKVAHLGDDIRKSATEKFQKISAAYEEIKKQRGIT